LVDSGQCPNLIRHLLFPARAFGRLQQRRLQRRFPPNGCLKMLVGHL
jgi:hypothetical protein